MTEEEESRILGVGYIYIYKGSPARSRAAEGAPRGAPTLLVIHNITVISRHGPIGTGFAASLW